MKVTIELPDTIFRRARALAQVQGITLRRFVRDAIEQRLRRHTVAPRIESVSTGTAAEPPWMSGFGRLSDLSDEHRLVLDAIEEEFENLPPDNTR